MQIPSKNTKTTLKSANWQDCPHCQFYEDRGQSMLKAYCPLHQKICDLGEDLHMEKSILAQQNEFLKKLRDTVQQFLIRFDSYMEHQDLYPDSLAENRDHLQRALEETSDEP